MLEVNETRDLNYNDTNILNNNLSEEEILKCKENYFILLGKTGVWKTSLLNIIFGEDVWKVGYSSISETKESKFYCIKEKSKDGFKYFCILDTPGLYDTNGIDADITQKNDILNLISKEKIKIKAILFLFNLLNERFDFSEQNTLIEYNGIFRMKDFWRRIILIFTHYYGDPEGDTKEEIEESSLECFIQIMKRIMEKIKNVSDPVEFQDLNRKYINIYSKAKNDKQIKSNLSIRNNLLLEIYKYIEYSPMFSKLKIFNFEKYEIEKEDDFIYACILIIYLDAKDNIINKDFNILKKYLNNKFYKKEQRISYDT